MPAKTTDKEIINLVEEFHFKQGKSLRMIERENGFSNDTIRKRCLKLGIKTKSRLQSIKDSEKHIIRPKGENHWSNRKPELHAKNCKASSDRMKKNNPMNTKLVVEKAAASKAITYSKNPTFHESMIIDLLSSLDVRFKFQQQISQYVADFVIDSKVILEIDGRGHASRKATDLIRDKLICGLGFYIVRVDQDVLFNKRAKKPVFRPNKLIRVIEDLIPSLNISNLLPPVECKHRVIVRKPNPFTEIIY